MPFGLSSNRRSRNIDVGKIPDSMKAVVVREHGGLDILKYEESLQWAVPKRLDRGQVLVKNEYAGLNFIDVYYRSGLYTKELPFILGQEGGGVVVKKHRSVIDVEIGDKVVYLASGTYCEYTKVSEDKLIKVPNQLSVEAAICCMMQGLTAHYLTTDAQAGHTSKGDWILIYSVTSGTGQWAAQIAKIQGYKVIGTTSETKKDILPEDWIDEMIVLSTLDGKVCSDYESVDFVDIIMEITDGEGVKCILDGIGKSTADISIDCLSKRGLWLSYGTASGPVPPMSLFKLTKKSAYCACPKLGDYISTKEEFRRRAQEVFEYVILGDLNIRVDLIVPLENAREGHAYLEGGRSKGKVLFQCDNQIEEGGEEEYTSNNNNNNNNTRRSNGTTTTTTTTQQSSSRFSSFFGRRRRQQQNTTQPQTTVPTRTPRYSTAAITTSNEQDDDDDEEEEEIEEVDFSPTNYMSSEKVDGDII